MQNGSATTAGQRAAWGMDEAHGRALERRGLSVELAARLGWQSCAGPTDDLWIAIPYYDDGKRVGCKYRTLNGNKLFSQDKGSEQVFWNIDCLRDPELAGFPLVITEGEMDALAAIQAGYPKTISVPGGAPQHDNGEDGLYWQYLARVKQLLDGERTIILATDNDANGRVLQQGLARRLGRARCQVPSYPDLAKDLNDVLMAHGLEAVRHTLGGAAWLPLPGLFRLRDLPEREPNLARDTMIPGLGRHMRLRPGDLVVVTGPPNHGKSTFVQNLICNMAWHWNIRTALCSMEQPIKPDLRRMFRSYRAECLEKHMSEAQRQDADEWIDRNFIFLQGDDNEAMTLPWILERFAAARQRYDCGICLIDPWNEVAIGDKPVDLTTEQWVSQSLRAIKNFARVHDVTFIVVAHPAKMRRDRNGKVPKPTLYDVADTAAWNNRSDLGVVVWRPELTEDGLTEIEVVKSRDFYAIGVPGMVSLRWQMESSRFVDRL